ncbi:MAG: hypothetical protein A3E78_04935 [Alphaproteobacteria bacterium RIFCSPHIGHO2_12_FULL_63_12]|nr:MAG: hypothetical protein A3E78_04935 [Alphaproteobacteria bacterium RIFCSPHIGHO2_12_FULL_63_12]
MNKLTLASIALLQLAAPAASAAMTARQVVEKEVVTRAANGVETVSRAAADKVTPGETVIYSIKYKNDSPEGASDIVLVMPVPKEVSYVEGSVSGDDTSVAFSADGGKTYVARGRLTVEEGGATRPARGDEITHIRWTLTQPVPPKGEGEVSYKAILR